MPAEKVQPLGDVADLLSGGTPSKSAPEFWSGNIPWLTPKDMGNWTGATEEAVSDSAIGNGTRLAPPEASFIAVRGMSLHNEIRIVRANAPIAFNQDIKAVVPRAGIQPEYLFQVLVSKKPELLGLVEAAGHGTGRLPTDQLLALKVPRFGSKAETAIAEFIGALDDKIDLNRRMNDTLERMARAIFKSWFVDFDPVRIKMDGRDTGLADDVAALFPDAFDEGEGRILPKGWAISSIGQEVDVVGGNTPSTKDVEYWGGQFSFATPKDLSDLNAPILLGTERHLTESGVRRVSSGLLPPGTVLMSSRAPIGYVAISSIPVCVNQGFAAMVCKRSIGPVYAYFWTLFSMEEIKGRANGSTFAEISKSTFRETTFVRPPEPLAEIFEKLAAPIFDRISINLYNSRALSETRDLLLPKLMSGEVGIRGAEKLVSEAGA
jgi:type I restriction enzyme S subunit